VKEEESGRETCVCVSETGKVFVYGSKIVCLCFCICVCVCIYVK
jgi:hypothetical protein